MAPLPLPLRVQVGRDGVCDPAAPALPVLRLARCQGVDVISVAVEVQGVEVGKWLGRKSLEFRRRGGRLEGEHEIVVVGVSDPVYREPQGRGFGPPTLGEDAYVRFAVYGMTDGLGGAAALARAALDAVDAATGGLAQVAEGLHIEVKKEGR